MLKLRSRGAALLLTGAAFTLAAGVLPAQAASTTWQSALWTRVKGKGVTMVTGIDALSAGNAWAAGDAASDKGTNSVGLIRHWNGRAWKGVTLPSPIQKDWNKYSATNYATIGASASTNVWVFGDLPESQNGDGYIRLNGHKWSAGILPGSRTSSGHAVFVTGARVFSRSDVWVFGGQASPTAATLTFSPYAAHFNGTKWKTYKVPGSGAITAASEISATNISAVLGVPWIFAGEATAASPALVQWNGTKWTAIQAGLTFLPAGANLTSVLASRGNIWIGGGVANSAGGTNEFAADLKGSTGTLSSLSAPVAKASFSLIDMVPDGSGGIWGLAQSTTGSKPRFWHLTSSAGTTWTSARDSLGGNHQVLFQLANVPHSTSVWGVGALKNNRIGPTYGLFALYGAVPR
jgi:hypothetical protein